MSDQAQESSHTHYSHTELEMQQKYMDNEISTIKNKLETWNYQTGENFKALEKSVAEIKDMATRALHVSIGVDGRNGLRGSLETIIKDMNGMSKDFEFLRSSAHSYVETRSLLLKLFAVSAAAVVVQLCGIVWYFGSQHSRQEVMREDLNKVIGYIEKMKEDTLKK
jgi:hypothetical protein